MAEQPTRINEPESDAHGEFENSFNEHRSFTNAIENNPDATIDELRAATDSYSEMIAYLSYRMLMAHKRIFKLM